LLHARILLPKSTVTSELFAFMMCSEGVPHLELLEQLKQLSAADKSTLAEGRFFAYVYTGEDGQFDLQKKAYAMFEGIYW